jgi:hypothetical protein
MVHSSKQLSSEEQRTLTTKEHFVCTPCCIEYTLVVLVDPPRLILRSYSFSRVRGFIAHMLHSKLRYALQIFIPNNLQFFIPNNFLRFKGIPFKGWRDPKACFSRSTPLHCILASTPLIGTSRFLECRADQFQRLKLFHSRWSMTPMQRYREMCLEFMILIKPAMFGIVMNKNTAVPRSIQTLGTTMKTLARFVE